jgi:hypothetical protein
VQAGKQAAMNRYLDSKKQADMKEENGTGRKANSGANAPFDASDFIHNVALAGNREDKPATTQTESQAVIPAELSEANGERPA